VAGACVGALLGVAGILSLSGGVVIQQAGTDFSGKAALPPTRELVEGKKKGLRHKKGLCPRHERKKCPLSRKQKCPDWGIIAPNAYERMQLDAVAKLEDAVGYQAGGLYFERGTLQGMDVAIVTCGLGMINAGAATQTMIELYNPGKMLVYGIAGAISDSVSFADVVVPGEWVNTGLYVWTRAGYDAKTDELPLEGIDYQRAPPAVEFKFDHYATNPGTGTFYVQPSEEMAETPEETGKFVKAMYLKVDPKLLKAAQNVAASSDFTLPKCLPENATQCLDPPPVLKVQPDRRGSAANFFSDNAEWASFLDTEVKVSVNDMETTAVFERCQEYGIPFLGFRAASDKAGTDSASNEADEFTEIAALNAAMTMVEVMKEYESM